MGKTIFTLILALTISIHLSVYSYAANPGCNQKNAVTVSNNRISVCAVDKPMAELLKELQKAANITVTIDDTIDDKITITLDDIPIEEGLKRLFKQSGYAMVWKKEENVIMLDKLWVVRQGGSSKNGYNSSTGNINFVQHRNTEDPVIRKVHLDSDGEKDAATSQVSSGFNPEKNKNNNYIASGQKGRVKEVNHDPNRNDDISGFADEGNNFEENEENDEIKNNIVDLMQNASDSTLSVTISNTENLGAYEFSMHFDPEEVQIENIFWFYARHILFCFYLCSGRLVLSKSNPHNK